MNNRVVLYGHRPREHEEVWYLSPYEFMVYWTVKLADYSRREGEDHAEFPARLTDQGWEN